jgi:hypothetical protein
MEAKVRNHVWTIEEIVDLIPDEEVVILKAAVLRSEGGFGLRAMLS